MAVICKVFLVIVVVSTVFVSRCLGKYCDGDAYSCSPYQVCCNNKCRDGTSCIGHSCIDFDDCLSSEFCCNDVCVKGANCLGRRCLIDRDCRRPQEKCCMDKCVDSKSSGLCVDTIIYVLIVLGGVAGCLGFFGLVGGVIVYCRTRRRAVSTRGQVIALPPQHPYEQFNNEEPLNNQTNSQETSPATTKCL